MKLYYCIWLLVVVLPLSLIKQNKFVTIFLLKFKLKYKKQQLKLNSSGTFLVDRCVLLLTICVSNLYLSLALGNAFCYLVRASSCSIQNGENLLCLLYSILQLMRTHSIASDRKLHLDHWSINKSWIDWIHIWMLFGGGIVSIYMKHE